MTQYKNELTNQSYTQKDFGTVYPELLDLIKKLSPKWDPSVSDEADPGVLLIKLAALIADKNNYNIDKSILECLPISVTQESNARELFAQLGYYMKWYNAGTGKVTLKWLGDKNNVDYVIPRFSMIADEDNQTIYTIPQEIVLRDDGTFVDADIIQGTKEDFSFNGDGLITLKNLDSDNRLYFPRVDVAENGIFICNADTVDSSLRQNNYDVWKKVDNLYVEQYGQYIYKFGVSANGDKCYIEFAEDIQDLIGAGLYITYILTDGTNGNVSKKTLTQFYVDTTAEYQIESGEYKNITISKENVLLSNLDAIQNGTDPEDIDTAYKNYKKTVGTFKTLVSLRDYNNAVRNSGFVSNAFVTDRINDVQSSYKIITNSNDIEEHLNLVESVDTEATNVDINGLKHNVLPGYLYNQHFYKDSARSMLIQPNENTLYIDLTADRGMAYIYNRQTDTFTTLVGTSKVKVKDLDSFTLKLYALQYVDTTNNATLFDRSFDVIPYTQNNVSPVITNLIDATSGYLSDVKCIQHDFKYQQPFKPVLFKNKYNINVKIIPQYRVTSVQEKSIQDNIRNELFNKLNSKQLSFGEEISYDLIYDTIMGADDSIKAIALDNIEYDTYAVYYDNTSGVEAYKEINISNRDLYSFAYFHNNIFYSDSSFTTTITPNESLYYVDILTDKCYQYKNGAYHYVCPNFATDIFAKNVLCGTTQLLEPDTTYKYGIDQNYKNTIKNIKQITTNANCCCVKEKVSTAQFSVAGNTSVTLCGAVYEVAAQKAAGTTTFALPARYVPKSLNIRIGTKHIKDIDGITLICTEDNNIIGNIVYGENPTVTITGGTFDSSQPLNVQYVEHANSTAVTIIPGTLKMTIGDKVYYDTGSGTLYGDDLTTSNINYISGVVTFTVNPVNNTNPIILEYEYVSQDAEIAQDITYDIRENENIHFVAPNLIQKNQYSSYVIFQYKLALGEGGTQRTIPANSDYQLRNGESITLYWGDPDDEDAKYSYYKYGYHDGRGDIINPTFSISTNNNATEYVGENFACGKGTVINDDDNAFVKALLGVESCVLSGTKTINIKDINEVVINDSTKYCYWVLNAKNADDKYELFSDSPTDNEYILQQDEYFIYGLDNGDRLVILENGTKIKRNCTSGVRSWCCSPIAYSEIDSEGASVLHDMWARIPDGWTITAQEMQFISLGKGTTLKMTNNSNKPVKYAQFTNDGYVIKATDNTTLNLSDFAMSYCYDNEWSTIPTIAISGSNGWSPKAQLNLSLDPIVPQQLLIGQNIQWIDVNDATGYIYGNNDLPTNILNDTNKFIDGGVLINTTTLDEKNIRRYLNLYVYTMTKNDSLIQADSTISMLFTQSGSKQITFNLPSGKYILPFQMNTTGLNTVEVTMQIGCGTIQTLTPIGNTTITNLNYPKTYYLLMNIDNPYNYLITLTTNVTYANGVTGDKRLIFKNIYKYTQTDVVSQQQFNLILDRIITLDNDSKYDYCTTVSSDILIKNPLLASSFLNINHLFNSNTICQLDTKNITLYITNKIK